MAPRLPPDLERVGDELIAAVARSVQARRRRRRVAARSVLTGLAALAAAAAFAPAGLAPSTGGGADPLLARVPAVPAACDQPTGGRLALPVCAAGDPVPLGRPRRW
jgi:hypothetical protein